MAELSVWEKETFFRHQDVIIAGSGFTGLWSALHLKLLHPNLGITILERGLIPTGASTRNAGFSCFGSPSELIADALQMGIESMWKLVAQRYSGLAEIRRYFKDEEIDYDPAGGYECFTEDPERWDECISNLEWLNEGLEKITGEKTVFTIADHKLGEFGFTGFAHLVENKLEGGLHPGKLVQALLRKVQNSGVQVLTGIDVSRFEETANGITVFTKQGITLSAGQLLICTNAFAPQLLPSIDIIPNRGQVLITSPIEGLPFKGTFHFDRGYYYFRNLGNRLLIGGARNKAFNEENTTDMETTPNVQQFLEDFIRQYLLPHTSFDVTNRWSGIMAMGSQRWPIVEVIGKNVYCCVRMSGMGVALAPVVAKEVVQLMTNQLTT